MRITDSATYILQDTELGLSRIARLRMYLAAVFAFIQLKIMPAQLSEAPLVLAHEAEVVDVEEVPVDER